VAYTIPVGGVPGEMAFSSDYTRLYVLTAPDSLAIVDALGYFRIGATALGLPGRHVATTGSAVYVTHPDADSVSVLSSASNALERRIWVGAGPTGIAAAGSRAFVAARYDRRLVIVEEGRAALGVPVDGEPHQVAAARNGRRVFTTVEKGGAWRLVVVAPEYPDTIQSLPLAGVPTAITTDATGDRVYVLIAGASRVDAFAEQADGRYRSAGSVTVGAGASGLSVRPSGSPLIVSGTPATIVDAFEMTVIESVAGVGAGAVGVRPDGVFAFVGSPGDRLLRVIGL
jgi:YVTN family beta-propeller protein